MKSQISLIRLSKPCNGAWLRNDVTGNIGLFRDSDCHIIRFGFDIDGFRERFGDTTLGPLGIGLIPDNMLYTVEHNLQSEIERGESEIRIYEARPVFIISSSAYECHALWATMNPTDKNVVFDILIERAEEQILAVRDMCRTSLHCHPQIRE